MSHIITAFPHDPILDLNPWTGQRQATFRFDRVNAVSGEHLGELHPIRGASLSHDTTRTIKRHLSMSLGTADTAVINPISDRVEVSMVFPGGTSYPLGRYMFVNDPKRETTAGALGVPALMDEMFLVDQPVTKGVNGVSVNVSRVIQNVLTGLPIIFTLDPSSYVSAEAWTIGHHRGQILESLAVSGDYFSPWFGNDELMHFIRTFNPVDRIPDFNFDDLDHHKVMRDNILTTNDLLSAPNRFIVVSNAAANPDEVVVGTADIASTAPHSIANRGFVVPDVRNLQLSSQTQATAVAKGLAARHTVFEQTFLTTAPDPRHDSYNTIRWRGKMWLELAWELELTEGGIMTHLLRRAYS